MVELNKRFDEIKKADSIDSGLLENLRKEVKDKKNRKNEDEANLLIGRIDQAMNRKRKRKVSPVVTSKDLINQENTIQDISIGDIELMEFQDRSGINEDGIKKLSDSIKRDGLLHPILVMQKGDKYIKIAGRRRIEATKLLGLNSIKAVVIEKRLDSASIYSKIYSENQIRENLNVFDIVRSYLNIIAIELGVSIEAAKKLVYRCNNIEKLKHINDEEIKQLDRVKEIILRYGDFNTVSNFVGKMNVLTLDPIILSALMDNKITFDVAICAKIYRESEFKKGLNFKKLLNVVIDKKLSTREAKDFFENSIKKGNKLANSKREKAREIRAKITKLSKLESADSDQAMDKILKILSSIVD